MPAYRPAPQEMKMGRLAPLSVILDACPRRLVIGDPGVFLFRFVREENDTGFPITNVGNDRFGLFSYQDQTGRLVKASSTSSGKR